MYLLKEVWGNSIHKLKHNNIYVRGVKYEFINYIVGNRSYRINYFAFSQGWKLN